MLFRTIILFLFIAQLACFGHASYKLHYYDDICVFNGFESPEFFELCKQVNSGLDSDLAKAFRDAGGILPGGPAKHRILGHGWSLNGSIPKDVLQEFDKVKPGQSKIFIKVWKEHVRKVTAEVQKLTGLPAKEASALADLLHEIHLLGDLTPDNVDLAHVLKRKDIQKNILKDCEILFGKNAEFTKHLRSLLKKIPKRGRDMQLVAGEIMDALYNSGAGEALRTILPKDSLIKYTDEAAKHATKRIANRAITKIPEITWKESSKGALANSLPKPNAVKTTKGVLRETIIKGKPVHTLSFRVPNSIKVGAAAGIVTLIMTEGMTIYSFAEGDITEDEFQRETIKNIGRAAVVGTTTTVCVALGCTPVGWVVIGVGFGAEIAYEVVFNCVMEKLESPAITMEDILGTLPTEIQRRRTFLEPAQSESFLELNNSHKKKFLDYSQSQESFLDYSGSNSSFLDYSTPNKSFLK